MLIKTLAIAGAALSVFALPAMACDAYEALIKGAPVAVQGEIVQNKEGESLFRITYTPDDIHDYNYGLVKAEPDGTITCTINPRMRGSYNRKVDGEWYSPSAKLNAPRYAGLLLSQLYFIYVLLWNVLETTCFKSFVITTISIVTSIFFWISSCFSFHKSLCVIYKFLLFICKLFSISYFFY